MGDVLGGVFGGYSNLTGVVSAATMTTILAEIDKFSALLPDATVAAIGTSGSSEANTDFDQIPPHTAVKLTAEIAAMRAAIAAAPTV